MARVARFTCKFGDDATEFHVLPARTSITLIVVVAVSALGFFGVVIGVTMSWPGPVPFLIWAAVYGFIAWAIGKDMSKRVPTSIVVTDRDLSARGETTPLADVAQVELVNPAGGSSIMPVAVVIGGTGVVGAAAMIGSGAVGGAVALGSAIGQRNTQRTFVLALQRRSESGRRTLAYGLTQDAGVDLLNRVSEALNAHIARAAQPAAERVRATG